MTFTHCKSYTGRDMFLGECVCKAGINPIDQFCGGNRLGWVAKVPCVRENLTDAVCDKADFPSLEEAREEAERTKAEMFEAIERIAVVRPTIIAEHKSTGRHGGKMECPICKGVRHWSVAKSNGHVHTQCETEGCAAWIE